MNDIHHLPGKAEAKAVIRQHRKASFYVKKYLMIFMGALIAAIGLELFLIPNNVIDGGIVGISIMMSSITGLSLGVFLVLLNIPGGIIDGLGVGLIIRAGGSLDGTEIVAIIMDRRSVFSVGEVVMFINLFILSSAGLLYGWDKAMYSLVAYFVISKMIDVVIKGLDESYAVMIVTNEHDEITSALNDRLGRGVTLLHGQGGYTGEAKEVLYCVVTRLEVDKLKEIVLEKDENAFVTINAVHDIVGGRFKKKAIH